MFLNDALCVFGRHVPIPDTLRIHDADGPIAADAEALTLGAITRPVGSRDIELFHAPFEVHPRALAVFEIGAVRPKANEEVTRQPSDAECASCFLGCVRSLGHPLDDTCLL